MFIWRRKKRIAVCLVILEDPKGEVQPPKLKYQSRTNSFSQRQEKFFSRSGRPCHSVSQLTGGAQPFNNRLITLKWPHQFSDIHKLPCKWTLLTDIRKHSSTITLSPLSPSLSSPVLNQKFKIHRSHCGCEVWEEHLRCPLRIWQVLQRLENTRGGGEDSSE